MAKVKMKDPTSHEVILGKKVKVGKGVGKRVAKKATSAIKGQRAALKKLFPNG